MLTLRRSEERGHADHGWLDARHTFSFADYHDPAHHHFRDLRVINEDRVAPGRGFDPHDHRDMEIVTFVLSGSLRHEDSLGNGSVLRYGDVQRMSAGTGVRHSERNPSDSEPLHLLQIWIYPDTKDLAPEWEERAFPPEDRAGRMQRLVSPDGGDGSLRIHADVSLSAVILREGESIDHPIAPGRHAWIQVASGTVGIGDVALRQGDGAAVSREESLRITGLDKSSEVLVFDLA
jgi:redox-sensitive bicupin YhaK (pirin superfamily)